MIPKTANIEWIQSSSNRLRQRTIQFTDFKDLSILQAYNPAKYEIESSPVQGLNIYFRYYMNVLCTYSTLSLTFSYSERYSSLSLVCNGQKITVDDGVQGTCSFRKCKFSCNNSSLQISLASAKCRGNGWRTKDKILSVKCKRKYSLYRISEEDALNLDRPIAKTTCAELPEEITPLHELVCVEKGTVWN